MPSKTLAQKSLINGSGLSLRWTDDLREFSAFWPSTDSLGRARCYVFQCADFLEVWCKTIGPARNTTVALVAIIDDMDRPLALLPLGIETRFGIRVLTFLDGGVSDYNSPVLFPETRAWSSATVDAIWTALREMMPEFDIALFEKMPGTVEDIRNPFVFPTTSKFLASGHFITLSEPWELFSATRLPYAEAARRKLRRLNELGTLTLDIARTPEERTRFLDALMRQKSRRYLETQGIDGLNRPGYRDFFEEATSRFASRGLLHLSALSLDGSILATQWAYVVRSRFYGLLSGFEGGKWRRYSPGTLLFHKVLEWAAKNNVRIFDCGIGDEEYKMRYCDGTLSLYQIEKAFTPTGHAYLLARKAKRALRETPVWSFLQSKIRKRRAIGIGRSQSRTSGS